MTGGEAIESLRAALDDRLGRLLAAMRRLVDDNGFPTLEGGGPPAAHLGRVEAQRAAIVGATVEMVAAVVAATVAEGELRDAVLRDLADRRDAIRWPRPWRLGGSLAKPSGEAQDALSSLAVLSLTAPHESPVGIDDAGSMVIPAGDRANQAGALRLAMTRMGLFAVRYDSGKREAVQRWQAQVSAGPNENWTGTQHHDAPDSYGAEALANTLDAHGATWIMWRRGGHAVPGTLLWLVGSAVARMEAPASLAARAAPAVLREMREKQHAEASERLAEDLLAQAVGASLAHLDLPPMDSPLGEDGQHPCDAALAGELEAIGEAGRKLAAETRDNAARRTPEERAARWWPPDMLRVARQLARALWHDRVRGIVERQRARTDAPGLALPVATSMVALARRGAQATMFGDSGVFEILDRRRKPVGKLQPGPAIDAETISIAHLGKLSAIRVMRWLLHRGYHQHYTEQTAEASRIDVEGGFSALARVAGLSGKKAAVEVKQTLDTLDSLWLTHPKGEGRVLGYHHHHAHGQQRARLEIHLMGPFAPDYISRQLADHRGAAADKYLVPVPLPQLLPPMVGRPHDHASQALLQLLVLREMRVRAMEMASTGSVEIDGKKWEELRDEAGVPRVLLPALMDAWTTGDDAVVLRPATDRYSLADAYATERAAIMEAGRAMERGRRGGRVAAAKRRTGPPKRPRPGAGK